MPPICCTITLMKRSVDLGRYFATVQAETAGLHAVAGQLKKQLPEYIEVQNFLRALNNPSYNSPAIGSYFEEYRYPRLTNFLYASIARNLSLADKDGRTTRGLSAIGSAILPLSGLPAQGEPRSVTLGTNGLTGCLRAERKFFNVLQTARGGKETQQQTLISVYHDENGTPVLLRKRADESSALTFQPMTFTKLQDGSPLQIARQVHVPAGALVAVNGTLANAKRTGSADLDGGTTLFCYGIDGITIRPIRLSAWAYADPEDRRYYALSETFALRPDRADYLSRTSLADFQQAAHFILAACNAAPDLC